MATIEQKVGRGLEIFSVTALLGTLLLIAYLSGKKKEVQYANK